MKWELHTMNEMMRESKIFNKQVKSRAPNYGIEHRLHWPESKQNGSLGAIGAQQEGYLTPMKPNLQGGYRLGQGPYGNEVVKSADKYANGYPYADIFDTCRTSSTEKVEKMRPTLTNRESNSGNGLEECIKAMHDLRVEDEGESRSIRSNPSSVSRSTELQSLSLLSENRTSKVKFMCRFGGKIISRITDGKLRYVGGESRIIAVNKNITYVELRRKLMDMNGKAFVLKYQLPSEDLDSLVSLSSEEDLKNMLEEYSRVEGGDSSPRLRIFLFSVGDNEVGHFDAINDKKNPQQKYVEALNDIMEAGARKLSWNTILDVSENGNARPQESIKESIFPAKDIAGNIPLSSMQCISYDQVTLPPSSHMLCSLPNQFEPCSASDVSTDVFQEKPLKNHNDVDYGGPISPPFQHSLECRLSDPNASELSPKTQHVFSHLGNKRDLLYRHDQHVSNAKLLQVGSHAMLTQMQDVVGVSRSALDPTFDVPTLDMDSDSSVFQHSSSSLCQPLWQYQSNVNHDKYISMSYTQQQPLQQYPVSHLNGQQLLSTGVTGFGHIDQPWLHKKNRCNDPSISGFISNQNTSHIIGGADNFLGPEGLQRTGTLEHIEVWKQPLVQELEHTQFGKNVYQYHDQINRVLIHHQEVSPAHSVTSLPDQMLVPLSAVSEGVVHFDRSVKPVSPYTGPSTIHDELTSCEGQEKTCGTRSKCTKKIKETQPNLLGLQSYVVTNGAAKYVVPQLSTLPKSHEKTDEDEGPTEFRMIECDDSSRHVVLPQTMLETEIKDGHAPQLSGSYYAQVGQNYTAVGFQENDIAWDSELTMGFPEVSKLVSGLYSYSESHRTMICKSFEGIYAKTPAILGQTHAGNLTGSSEASELFTESKEVAMPTSHSSHGTESLMPTSDLSSFTDHNDAMHSNVLSHMPAKRENSNSSSKEEVLQINSTDLHAQNKLKSDTPSSEPLQTSHVSQSNVDILKDIPSLSCNDSVSLSFQSDQESETASTVTTTEDNLDDFFTIELEGVAGNVAKGPSRPPPLLLQTFQTSSVNDWAHVNDHVNEENSNGRLIEWVEEENISIEQETKIKGLDNGDPLSYAVIAEAEAILRGLQTIKNADLLELRELGSGTFGTVFHGRWRGSDIAIKRIKNSCFAGRPSEQDSLKADFWSEACMLSQLRHPNIVAFYGVVPDGPGGTLGTVTEFMVNGSLKQFLQRNDRSIDHCKRIFIAMDAACGMEYLHHKSIVHFDLKCDNLLVNMKDLQRPICKVADFGLSKIKHQTLVSGSVRGSLPWMAPELLHGNSSMVSDKVDVFSFGIVMWELLTGKEPYADLHCGAIIGGILNNSLRPTVPTYCEPSWRSLMERCWSANSAARPSFSEIVDELQSMLASLSKGKRPSNFNSILSLKQF